MSDWKNFKRGENLPRAPTNPKYCYEWAFIEPGKVAVLNLWRSHGDIEQVINYREIAQTLRAQGKKPVWVKRAEWVDTVIRQAVLEKIPIHVILCDGIPRGLTDKASKVSNRTLDTVPWTISSYNKTTGQCLLRRGIPPTTLVDQFSIPNYENSVVDRKPISGEAYVRDSYVCQKARERAEGKCEFCSEIGFIRPNGDVFLEIHHIIPLSEDGYDNAENVAALCPNHHREAHLGKRAPDIRSFLINRRLAESIPPISYDAFLKRICKNTSQ